MYLENAFSHSLQTNDSTIWYIFFLELSENALVTKYAVESTMGINTIFTREKSYVYQMNPQTPNINVLLSSVLTIDVLSTDYLLLFDHFIPSNETHAE